MSGLAQAGHVVAMETVSDERLAEMLADIDSVISAQSLAGGEAYDIYPAEFRSALSELLASRLAKQAPATHRHVKRGSEYVLIGIGKMQAEDWTKSATVYEPDNGAPTTYALPVDMREVAIYRSATNPTEIWVRPREEFEDGRFEEIPSPVGGSVS